MNGVALLLAAASLAVDYSWDKNDAGQIEYMVRVEAEVIPSLIAGEEIHSDVPAEAGAVDRFRLRVGLDGNQPVFTPAAPGRFGALTDRTVMLVHADGQAEEVQGVSFGWQPDAEGKLLYYVQLDPALLKSLVVGDEIQALVDRRAGTVNTFVVFGGNKQLPQIPTGNAPRFGGDVAPSPPAPLLGTGNNSPAAGAAGGSRFGQTDGGAAPAAATETAGASRFGGATGGTAAGSTGVGSAAGTSRFGNGAGTESTNPNPAVGGSRFGDGPGGAGTAPLTGGNEPGRSTFGGNQPGTFNPPALDGQAGPTYTGRDNTARPPLNYQGNNSTTGSDLYPSNNGSGSLYRDQPAQNPPTAGRNFDNRPTLEPPASNSAAKPLTQSNPPQQNNTANQPPAANSQNSQFGDNRMAMVDPSTTRGAGALSNQPAAAPSGTAVASEKPWWWGWLVFASCALFLSVGANFYLGWTAVEFYHRYQRAVERLRSGPSAARA